MFTPSKGDVRRFYCDTWRKHRDGQVLTSIEAMALDWILEHPEYHEVLASPEAVVEDYRVDDGRTNPFLHLSMHLAIAEQLSIDQPPGIRSAYQTLVARRGDAHAAAHAVMDCLGEVIWTARQPGTALAPEEMSARYLDCVARCATRD